MSRRLLPLALGAFLLLLAPAVADDTSIFKDWKEVKTKGTSHAAERAAFWAEKGVEVKQKIWLGLMWQRAQEEEKSEACLQEFLAAPEMDPKNREKAAWTMVELARSRAAWADLITRAAAFRKEFPESSIMAEVFDEEGQAHRMAGDREKAIASFEASAIRQWRSGIVNLIDLYLCDGDLDKAKSEGARWMAEDIKGKEQTIQPLVEFLEKVGTPAPALEGVRQVGKGGEVTTLVGKPTVLYFWNMTKVNDGAFKRLNALVRAFGDSIQVAALSTYNKYDPTTRKIDEALTEEREAELTKLLLEQTPEGAPPAVIVPVDVCEGLGQKVPFQKTLVDAEGNFRYSRFLEGSLYDWRCVEFAVKKVLGR
jgi:hypothetical protein